VQHAVVVVLWEALVLLHKVGHGVVPVRRVALREEDGVVEPDVLVAGKFLNRFVKKTLRYKDRKQTLSCPVISGWSGGQKALF
jgi:hypothetical protein